MPELRASDLVVMDNLSSHKRDAVRERTEAAGATLRFLQPPQMRQLLQLMRMRPN